MSYGGSTKYCPRCNTLLPAQAPVCGTCGMQFSAPSDPGYGATQYGGQGAPGGWPQSQPQPGYSGYPPPAPPPYAPQPGYPGYPAAVAASPRKSNTGLIVTIVIVLIVVGGGAAGWFLYLNPGLCKGGPFFDRHGLGSNIPLPSGCKFNSTKTEDIGSGETASYWFWTVDSPNNPSTLNSFYTQNLPSNGWTQKDAQTRNGESELVYCRSGQALVVELLNRLQDNSPPLGPIDLTAPPGGSVLLIATTSGSRAVAQTCG